MLALPCAPIKHSRAPGGPSGYHAGVDSRDTLVEANSPGSDLAAALAPGTLFHERYRIARVLGGGAVGAVFECYDERDGRHVGVKVLHPSLMEQQTLVQRFRREAEIARRIRHPNIVEVLGYGRSVEGLHYLVMELLEGEDLERRLARPIEDRNALAVDVTAALLGALWVAHESGVVHRDVKPANIFLWRSKTGSGIKVLDFGMARDTEDDASLTRSGEVLGTPLYMSPEQACGNPVDSRADLYSAGCVAYELFCAVRPIERSSPYLTMLAHVDERPAPPSTVVPDLPPSVDAMIGRALEKDPGRRFQTASLMTEALARVAADLGLDTSRFEELTRSAESAVQALQDSWGQDPPPPDYLAPGPDLETRSVMAMLHGRQVAAPAPPAPEPPRRDERIQADPAVTAVIERPPARRSPWLLGALGLAAAAAVAIAVYLMVR